MSKKYLLHFSCYLNFLFWVNIVPTSEFKPSKSECWSFNIQVESLTDIWIIKHLNYGLLLVQFLKIECMLYISNSDWVLRTPTTSRNIFCINITKYNHLITPSCFFSAIRLCSDRQNTSLYHKTWSPKARVSINATQNIVLRLSSWQYTTPI